MLVLWHDESEIYSSFLLCCDSLGYVKLMFLLIFVFYNVLRGMFVSC